MSFTATIENNEICKHLINMFEIISDVLTNDYININSNYIEINAMDLNKVSLIHFKLNKNSFKNYNYTFDNNLQLAVNFQELIKILKLYKVNDVITFEYSQNKLDQLTIILKNDQITQNFSLKLLSIDTDIVDITDIKHSIDIDININLFKQILKIFDTINNESVDLCIDKNTLNIVANGDSSRSNILFNENRTTNYKFNSCKGSFKNTYGTEFLKKYKKSINDTINISFSENQPLILKINLKSIAPNTEDNIDIDYGFLNYYIAPKIDEN